MAAGLPVLAVPPSFGWPAPLLLCCLPAAFNSSRIRLALHRPSQDVLLTWGPFRQLLLFAFRRKHAAILQQALQQPPASAVAFDELEYYVDPQARSSWVLQRCSEP